MSKVIKRGEEIQVDAGYNACIACKYLRYNRKRKEPLCRLYTDTVRSSYLHGEKTRYVHIHNVRRSSQKCGEPGNAFKPAWFFVRWFRYFWLRDAIIG